MEKRLKTRKNAPERSNIQDFVQEVPVGQMAQGTPLSVPAVGEVFFSKCPTRQSGLADSIKSHKCIPIFLMRLWHHIPHINLPIFLMWLRYHIPRTGPFEAHYCLGPPLQTSLGGTRL